jgi:lysophospholipase L1-like esterase
LKPNQRCYTKVNRQPVEINAQRTRGVDFSATKASETIRVLCIGDSRTFGWGLSEKETYPAILQQLLRERIGTRVEVINAGVNGWTFPQMTTFLRDYAVKWQPDMVILGDGNLWTQFSEKNDPTFARKFAWRVRLKNALRRFALYHFVVEVQLRKIYEPYRSKFIPVNPAQDRMFRQQQQRDPAAFFRESIENFCLIARSNSVYPVLLYLPPEESLHTTNNQFAMVLQAKRDVARQLSVPLLDPTPELAASAKPLYLEGDPVHLNVTGNEIIGRRLFEVVSPLLKP